MKTTLKRALRIKSTNTLLTVGTPVNVKFVKQPSVSNPTIELDYVEVSIEEGAEVGPGVVLREPVTLKTRKFDAFFKAPSVRTLEKWSDDGVAKSVTGKRCEPDGYGDDGSPSWLLALGYI